VTLNPSFIGSGLGYAKDIDYHGLLDFHHIFSANLLLDLKASYTRSNNQSYPVTEGLNPNEKFGQPNVNTPISDSTGLMPISFLGEQFGRGSVLFQPLKDQDNTFAYLGAINYTRGAPASPFQMRWTPISGPATCSSSISRCKKSSQEMSQR
jgi:hypothetical protein